MQDSIVGLGEFATSARGGVTWVSHLSPNGVIKILPHEGVLCEGQTLEDHTRLVMCVIQEEW